MDIGFELASNESATLKRTVDLYIETGEPVSSKTLKRRYDLSQSTANIRMVMHALEDRGFLYKPHVSSGRVPTDAGYRYYVDNMMEFQKLSRSVLKKINDRIGSDLGDLRDIMLRTSRLLGEITSYMGLMMGVYRSYGLVTRLELSQDVGTRGLIVLRLSSGIDRSAHIDFGKRYREHILHRANLILNERICGCPLDEVSSRLSDLVKESAGIDREITSIIIDRAETLFDSPFEFKYYLKGIDVSNRTTEFRDPDFLARLVAIMGQRRLMLDMMKKRMEEGFVITIGGENSLAELKNFTVATRRFGEDDRRGLLGVLGPTRMSYKLVVPLLTHMADELNRS